MFSVKPGEAAEVVGRHMMVKDHFDMIMDLDRSYGPYIVDAREAVPDGHGGQRALAENERQYLDFYTQFASWPVAYNHPGLNDAEYNEKLLRAARMRLACSDIVTTEMAEFVATMHDIAIPPGLGYLFLIDGGALAVENALKTAFDWKVRLNFSKGLLFAENDYKIIHFREAFHGRSGYTMSLTNTDATKIKFFPKFSSWPRIENPKMIFPLEDHLAEVEQSEARAMAQIQQAIDANPHTIAAIILETIQGEGGDNQFRPEFFKQLRDITEAHDILLILDEVQSGAGITGKFWAFQHTGITPDIISFGKKMQVCGILASKEKLGRVQDHVFKELSRINSTWGGSLVDMVRASRLLNIIKDERLLQNATTQGAYLQSLLREMQAEFPAILLNARGKGLMCAVDFHKVKERDEFVKEMMKRHVLVLKCGTCSVRLRPMLDIHKEHLDQFASAARESLHAVHHSKA